MLQIECHLDSAPNLAGEIIFWALFLNILAKFKDRNKEGKQGKKKGMEG